MKDGKNRLWAAVSDAEHRITAERYAHSYANNDHCLIISPDAPRGFTEVGEELGRLLTADDWRWLLREADLIRREQEEKLHKTLIYEQERFIERFLAALKEETEAGPDEQKEKAAG